VRRLLALLLASLMLLATAACGNDDGSAKADVDMGQKIDGLSVSGSFGAEPKVKVSSAVKAEKPET
jgi:ABC-type glycerol-3-phosphate transport system substrate-binding protein